MLEAHLKAMLTPVFKSGQIDKEGYKRVLGRVVRKVVEGTTGTAGAEGFLNPKRREKIAAMVQAYLAMHRKGALG